MAKSVVWTSQARADVRAIEQAAALRILKALAQYARTNQGDVKSLRNVTPPMLRLRVQNYRVLFRDSGAALEIVRIQHRKDVYRDL